MVGEQGEIMTITWKVVGSVKKLSNDFLPQLLWWLVMIYEYENKYIRFYYFENEV